MDFEIRSSADEMVQGCEELRGEVLDALVDEWHWRVWTSYCAVPRFGLVVIITALLSGF